jgi:copper(I)-binding protein
MLGAMAALTLCACTPPAQEGAAPAAERSVAAPGVAVSDAWAAVTPGGATVGAGYMTISNVGPADTLVSVTSPRAPKVELHEMSMEGSMMRMRPVAHFTVPADGVVSLTPGGFHLMFLELPAPFVAGETVPVTLTFEHAGDVEVNLTVRERTASDAGGEGHEHH